MESTAEILLEEEIETPQSSKLKKWISNLMVRESIEEQQKIIEFQKYKLFDISEVRICSDPECNTAFTGFIICPKCGNQYHIFLSCILQQYDRKRDIIHF